MTQATIAGTNLARSAAPTLRVRRRYGRWVAAGVLLFVVAGVVYSLYSNKNLQSGTVRRYLFSRDVLLGVLTTIELTALCFVIGIIGGLALAVMRLSSNPVLSTVASVYVWLFRSIPPLVQLIFWGFFAALYPRVMIGVPYTHIAWLKIDTNSVLTPFAAAVVGLALIEIAYTAEVIRGGISGVESGQSLGARALGMSTWLIYQKIVLPQAMPAIVPPLGNNLVNLLKATSLVSVIGGAELMTKVEHIYTQNYDVIPLLCVAALWYLAITGVLSIVQSLIERHYSRARRSMATRNPNKAAGLPSL